jgi:prophage antirepressor-like protein
MQLQIFKYESEEEQMLNQIRTIEIDGEIWFVAKDVAEALGYKNPQQAVRKHCKKAQSVGGAQNEHPTSIDPQTTIIPEPDLYRLIIRSKLPSAEKFENWVFGEVIPSIRKKGFYGKIDRTQLPNFIERYRDNYHKLPSDHFSVISEMFARLFMALEKVGYIIPDKGLDGKQLMPDISVGLGFAKFLRDNNSIFFDTHKTYKHSFPGRRQDVEANMYHIDALPMFIRYINEVWIPKNASQYFKKRDPVALDYLPKLLA